jgi:hypothetical protein
MNGDAFGSHYGVNSSSFLRPVHTLRLVFLCLIFGLSAMGGHVMADATPVPASNSTASGDKEDFGKYLADHEDDIDPFFSNNAGDLIKQALPFVLGIVGWLALATMLIGWIVDVLLSKAYAHLFAPAFSDFKRSLIYASGALFLSFVYALLIGLIVVFCLGLPHAVLIIGIAMILLLFLAFAAQVVWILYLYRTEVPISTAFYLAIVVAHFILAILISGPLIGLQASSVTINFVDRVITPKMAALVETKKKELDTAATARDAVRSQVDEVKNRIAQAQIDQDTLQKEIEARKNSDQYIYSQIGKSRAQGDLISARDQYTAFLTKFPASPLAASAHTQIEQIGDQLAQQDAQKKQQEADTIREEAQAKADLLARAAKGEATLSEMRQALIGKTRDQVSSLLGLPSVTASDQWDYHKMMIVNPLTNEKTGLTVYFDEGSVQGVDYNRDGGTP